MAEAAIERVGAWAASVGDGSGPPPDVRKMTVAELGKRLDEAGIPVQEGVDRDQLEHAVQTLVVDGRMPTDAQAAFRLADIDRSGDLDRDEVKILLAACGFLYSPEGVQEAFAEMDDDGDGSITPAEFEQFWASEIAPNVEINERTSTLLSIREQAGKQGIKTLRDLFEESGEGASGVMDRDEVRVTAAKLGLILTAANEDEVFVEMDTDGDGQITRAEFSEWWEKSIEQKAPVGKPPALPSGTSTRAAVQARVSRTSERESRRAKAFAEHKARKVQWAEAYGQKIAQVKESDADDDAQGFVPAKTIEVLPASEPAPGPTMPTDREWTECCCGYLQKQLEPHGSRFTRRWYSLQTGSEGGLQMTYAMAPPEHQEPKESPTVTRLRRRLQQEADARRQREQYQVGRNEIFHNTGLKHGVSEWRATGVSFDLGGGPPEAATPDRALFRSALIEKVPVPEPEPEPEPESVSLGLTTPESHETISGSHPVSRSLDTHYPATLDRLRQKQRNRPPVRVPLCRIIEVRRGLGAAALGHADATGATSLSRERLDFTVAYEIPDPEATEDMAPVQHELRLRAASVEEADCWYDCLESARVMQHATARLSTQTGAAKPLGEMSPTLRTSAKSSRRRDPEASTNAIAAAGGMDELQAEIERMRKQAPEPRGESSKIAEVPAHDNDASPSSVQTMLRRVPNDSAEEEEEPNVDAWGRQVFVDADSYRPPGMLDPERGQLLWLQPSPRAAAFDLGQPYGTDYRLHGKTVHDCGSTVTGRTFDIGRPFQQMSVFVGQKPVHKKKPKRRRNRMMSAAASLGFEGDEPETPEQVVQDIMSDPLKVEQLRSYSASHCEKIVNEAVISELSGDTEDGRVHYVVKHIKPRKLVIPMEKVEVGIRDSRQGIFIIAEDLELRTEEFVFELTGQKGLATHFVNDQGTALAGCEELGVEIRFDVEIDESTGYPQAKNVEAVVAVGPLELNITAAKNKRSLNAITTHMEAPVRKRVEAELNEEINEHIDALAAGLNEELQKHLLQEAKDATIKQGLRDARAGGAGWGGMPKGFREFGGAS